MKAVFWVVSIVAYGIAFGATCANLASKKGYDGYFWSGFFFGVLGLVYVAGLPESPEQKEAWMKLLAPKEAQTTQAIEAPRNSGRAPMTHFVSSNSNAHISGQKVRCPKCDKLQDRGSLCKVCGASLKL